MSLIHQKLYQSSNSTLVNMKKYISELAEYLEASFNMSRQVRFDLRLQALELDISQAIPIGLILNEAITNAIKYAFPHKENGLVSIALEGHNENMILLEINDNGIGLPPSFDVTQSKSMGLRLMKGLIKQIGGKLVIKSEHGVRIRIEFKKDNILRSVSIKEMTERAEVLS
jgi:two-component sensor histidine kinase